MEFLEKDLEQIIYETSNNKLFSRGLTNILCYDSKKKRQLKIGNYGVCDLIFYTRSYDHDCSETVPLLEINVLELKKDKIGISAFLQAVRYAKGISHYLSKRNITNKISIVLIGRTIDVSDFIYLTDMLPTGFLTCYTYCYDVDGIKFNKECNYVLTNHGLTYKIKEQ